MIEIDVADDGAGVDLSEVRAAAVRGRVLAPDAAEALDDEAALELIYRSGLSTSPLITELSGHGLGLPIVRERVEQLGGRVRVETASGQGTTVRLTVPSSMTAFRGLLVLAGVQVFLLPIESVQRAVRFSSSDVRTLGGREVLVSQGAAIPLAQLAVILGLDAGPGANGDQTCVLVASGGIVAAIIVDDLLGDREVLVKEFQAPLLRVHYVSAAGLLGTGELALILRPRDLVRAAEGRGTGRRGDSAPTEQIRQLAILVVDDSITTRTMEKTLLEAEGYRVRVAVDGLDAWTILKTEELDLVLSDVDMPRMDGLELTARIRADAQLADLPVVLVTALESREDKERGVEVGANAYVVKSSFDQANVLSTIRRLI